MLGGHPRTHVVEREIADVRAWVAAEQPRAWAPRRVVTVAALPLLPNGKVDRLAVERIAVGGGE